MMEHLTLTPGIGSVREYTAHDGYEIVSRKTGKRYTRVCTADIKQFDVVKTGTGKPAAKKSAKRKENK